MAKTFLIVDDEAKIADILGEFIEDFYGEDSRIVKAFNGKEALTSIDKEDHIDLIFLDIIMPELNGIKFIELRDFTNSSSVLVFINSYNLVLIFGKTSWQVFLIWLFLLTESINLSILSLDSIIHEMRLLKEDIEIEIMKKAASITTEAHIRAMQAVKPGMYEYQLEAEYLYAFNKNGARSPAYNSIVGGGNNSCILHYVENNSELIDGDLVLVDAGCEYRYYASDVTRTFPVNGKFSPEQKEIYSIVLEAHQQSMDQAVPGNKWNLMHEKSIEVIVEGLLSLKLLKGSKEEVNLSPDKASEEDAPIVKLVNLILTEAIKEDSSDVHIEPGREEVNVRIRIDGVLVRIMTPPASSLNGIVTRIKILSKLNIVHK